ncbi:MAG: glycosyltransferase [Thermoplasmatales archaeon]
MQQNSVPIFSVIITAHNRSKYVVSALESVLSQSLDRKLYEVIIVMNFYDFEIEKIAEANGVLIQITQEKPLTRKIVVGSRIAQGRYLCFLDDDDQFAKNKLERIYTFINKIGEIGYYHNSIIKIDELGFPLKHQKNGLAKEEMIFLNPEEIVKGIRQMIHRRADWYCSCICIDRNSLSNKLDSMWETEASADRFLFFAGISSGRAVITDNHECTLYRVHESLTSVISGFNDFIDKKSSFYLRSYMAFESMSRLYVDNYVSEYVECFVVHAKILNSFLGTKNTVSIIETLKPALISYFKIRHLPILFWYLMLVLRRMFGKIIVKLYYHADRVVLLKLGVI